MDIQIYDRQWLDENQYQLTDTLFQKFNLLNEADWSKSETVGICFEGDDPIGVIIGYGEVCIICQVAESWQRQGIGTQLVRSSKMFYPKQNGAPEFWEAIESIC